MSFDGQSDVLVQCGRIGRWADGVKSEREVWWRGCKYARYSNRYSYIN